MNFRPSPNFGERRNGVLPTMVVIHYTGMATCEAALDRLCSAGSEVSSHYLISETGEVFHLVDEAMRAWHAGAGSWAKVTDVNSASVGIELANPGPLAGFPPFSEPQMQALAAVLAAVLTRWSIKPENVVGHCDTAPGRKFDPGPKFDWARLELTGLAQRQFFRPKS